MDGKKPVQSKVKAIVDMPPPDCKTQVQLFIEMVNYLSKFPACLSELVGPIRELSKDKAHSTGDLNIKSLSSW